jgi:hypothetical protein
VRVSGRAAGNNKDSPALIFGRGASGGAQGMPQGRPRARPLLVVRVNRIIEAVKSTVPQQMWGQIIEKLKQPEQHQALDVEIEAVDEADDGYDLAEFAEFAEEDDEFRPSRPSRG